MGSSGSPLPTRLMSTKPSQFWGMVKKNCPQSAVFVQGQPHPPGFEGAEPLWLNHDFTSIAAYDTLDNTWNIPDGFHLLGVSAQGYQTGSPGTAAPFKGFLYDVDRQIYLLEVGARSDMAFGKAPGWHILSEPYEFASGGAAQCFVRATNLSNAIATLSIALFGFVGGEE